MTSEPSRRVHGACPLDCPDTCSWIVDVNDGTPVKLTASADHPFTRGALCVKVNDYLSHARATGRLLYPQRRVGAKGEGRFARISWDEALDEVACRLRAIIAEWGGQAVWPYCGTGTMGYLQGVAGSGRRLWNSLGASQHDAMTICSAAGLAGMRYVLGTTAGMDPEGFADSRLILLWGTNVLTTGPHVWRFVLEARRRGAFVAAIDPVATRTALAADEHLAPQPGTDGALALGLLHVVVSLGAEDRGFLAQTIGWEPFRTRILEFPPDRVAEICRIPAERIVALGTRLARTRPTGIRAGMGLQRHAGGGAVLRVLAALAGVTGDWGRLGGGVAYSTGAYFRGNEAALLRDDLRPPGIRTLQMTRLGTGLLDLDDPPVKALFVWNANPLASNPDQQRIRRGLARDDLFCVVVDHFQTDTADHADLLLPSTMQTEHCDLHSAYGHLYLAWNGAVSLPPGECLSNSELFRRLARRMGIAEPAVHASDEELARCLLDSSDPCLTGITFEELRGRGWLRLNYPRPHVPFTDGFPTPSGRLELFSEQARADGLDPLPGYEPPREMATPGLALIAAAAHGFLNSTFAHRAEKARLTGPLRIMLHPDDAARRGLCAGDRARVTNERGDFHALVEVSHRVRPGVVATTKGYWPKRVAGARNANATTAEADADMAGGAVFHDNTVEVERLD